MKLKQRIILFAVIPLLVVLCFIALTVHRHSVSFEQLREVIKEAYLATRDAELKNYVELAKRSIRDVNEAGPADEKAKEEAKAILAKLEYGQDVFFFCLT
jgi:two-component system NarL family sensor kinase